MSTTITPNGTTIIVDETVVIKTGEGGGGDGTPGSKTYKGTAIPSNGLGVNGDTYIRSNGDLYDKIAGSWVIQFSIKGPQGDTGAKGDTGTAGTPGAKGDTGNTGNTGNTGAAGLNVLSGSGAPSAGTGVNGESYNDVTNSMMYGPKSAGAWPAGVSYKGTKGDTGTTGNTGTAGVDGRTILNGIIAPINSQGANGDFYLDTAAQLIYGPKAAGAWPAGVSYKGLKGDTGTTGTTGNTGTAGTNGTNGNTVLTTSGQPVNGTGVNGDYAYDPTAKIMYGPKTAGAWSAGTSLQGTPGTTGTTGTAGRSIQVFTSAPTGTFGTNYFAGDVVML